jgi:predicted Zn-dependent protease
MTWTRRLRSIVVVAALAAAAGTFAGCAVNPVTGQRELSLISREQEIKMGEEAAPKFAEEFGGPVRNEALQTYVRTVGGRLAAVADRPMPYEYTLVASEVPNAFALPGGKIFITAGLLRRMTNERQLAAVLGHETAHVAAKHSVQGMQKQMGAQVLVELAARVVSPDKAEAAKAAASVVANMASLKYSRNDEYEADRVGLTYATRAGYNPWGMVELMEVLQSLNESEPGTLGEMFQTHPISTKRMAEARQAIAADPAMAKWKEGAPDANAAAFLRLRNQLPAAPPAK